MNTIRPQRRARTRDAVAAIRHVFLDADRDGPGVLAEIDRRRDLPPPSCVVHSSPNRLHVLWRVSGFAKEEVEALQKQLAAELGTDKAATSCVQMTRLPGLCNHKYRPGPMVAADYASDRRILYPRQFPAGPTENSLVERTAIKHESTTSADIRERARKYIAAIPPAVAGNHGDAATFRVCCRLVRGFALSDDDALAVMDAWNEACCPPWSEAELRAKLAAARRYGREAVGGLIIGRPQPGRIHLS